MAPAQPSAPLPPDTSTPLSTRIPSVRKPVHDTLRMYPKPSHSDLFCCHPAWCRPVSCQFWWPWQYACVSLLCAVPFTATEGLFPHSGNSCLPCYSLHLEQSPDLVVAFEAPPMAFPTACGSVFSLHPALLCGLGLAQGPALPWGCRWRLLEVNYFKHHLR